MNLSTEQRLTIMENRLVVAKRKEAGVVWIGSLGLVDTNYCIYLFIYLFIYCLFIDGRTHGIWRLPG